MSSAGAGADTRRVARCDTGREGRCGRVSMGSEGARGYMCRGAFTLELVVEVCSRRDAGVSDRVEPYHEVRGEGLEGSRERRNRKRYRWRTRTQGCVEWY